jgi:hypothetical protein
MDSTGIKYPEVKVRLSGQDGNVFNLIGACRRAARKAGVSVQEIEDFSTEVRKSGSYDEALRVMMAWFNVV